MTTPLDVLLNAREFLSDKDNWCPEGEGNNGRSGHKKCAMVAVNYMCDHVTRPYNREDNKVHNDALRMLTVAAEELFGLFYGVIAVNRKGYDAVMKMYDYAIAKEIAKDTVLVVYHEPKVQPIS